MADDEKLAMLAEMRADLPKFGERCLKLRAKNGDIVPFKLNAAQQFVHDKLEAQKAKFGWVRAIILKGRQQGISTLVAARFYHRTSMRKGTNTYILSHEQTSADTLFGIVDRYHRNNPIRPSTGTSNAKELVFDKLDSSYQVATAGTKAGGRGRAISLFHGSEVAFWANAADHFAASVQGVPLVGGTEVILESTSNGAGGEYYSRWHDAMAESGDYIPIFLPWWLSEEYSRDPEEGFQLSEEPPEPDQLSEAAYATMYGLSLRQMAWRRGKIQELRSAELFRREYPAYPGEAWTDKEGVTPFISALAVIKARKRKREGVGPLVIGVDPASMGGDRFSVAARRGLRVLWVKHRRKINTLEGTEWLRALIAEHRPARVNIDAGNIGAAIITNLKAIDPYHASLVRGVNFGGTSQAKLARPKAPGPINRRAEMWDRSREWLDSEEGVQIPDDDGLQTDATAPRKKHKDNNNFGLESKEDMKARQVKSPDGWDSVAITFAFREFLKDYYEPATPAKFAEDLDNASQSSIMPPLSGPYGWLG